MTSGKKIVNKSIILLLVLLMVTLSISCNKVAQKTLIESLLAACGDYYVFLSAWWNKAEDQQPENDPSYKKKSHNWVSQIWLVFSWNTPWRSLCYLIDY